MVAEDNHKKRYGYSKEGFSRNRPDIGAKKWPSVETNNRMALDCN